VSALAQDALVWLIVGAAALYAAARLGLVPVDRLRRRQRARARAGVPDVPIERLTRGKRRANRPG